jgi:hypothetical protein
MNKFVEDAFMRRMISKRAGNSNTDREIATATKQVEICPSIFIVIYIS